MTRTIERLNVAANLEIRASGDGKSPGTLVGYAAKFGALSRNLGGFVERIDPAAFNKSLADKVRVMCRYNHDDEGLLGTTDAGTLTLRTDDVGLEYAVVLPDTNAGRDVAALAGRGDLRYSSFAFVCLDDEWSVSEQGYPVRTVKAAALVDVAPVNDPAYLDTTAAMRSLSAALKVTVDEVRTLTAETIRDRLAAPTPPASDPEQRDPHSVPVSIQRRLADLVESK